jgi:hypothetical protein
VRAANPAHPESGRKRYREIHADYRKEHGGLRGYSVKDGRFYPTADFKAFCRRKARSYELN